MIRLRRSDEQANKMRIAKLEKLLRKASRKVDRAGDQLWQAAKEYSEIKLKFGERVTEITLCHSPEGSGHEPEDDPEY